MNGLERIIKDHIKILEELYAKNELLILSLEEEIWDSQVLGEPNEWKTKEMRIVKLTADNVAITKEMYRYGKKLRELNAT